jgi:DNA-binding transcriptional MerR regulator
MASATQHASDAEEKALFRIGEVSRLTATKPFTLRFWEQEFPTLQPVKTPSGRRLYRREDIDTVFEIKRLLYEEGFTIPGARKYLAGQSGSAPATGAPRDPSAVPVRPPSRVYRKLLLDLREELAAVLTLLERE